MNSSRPSPENEKDNTNQANSRAGEASARRAFNWIDLGAVPIAAAIMDAQPVTLFLLVIPKLFSSQNSQVSQPVLDGVTITLLLLGLYWWALFVQRTGRRGERYQGQRQKDERWERRTRLLHSLGFALACAFTLVTHLELLDNLIDLLLALGLIIWFWRRGIDRSRYGLAEEQLVISFRVGFGLLIALLVLTALYATLDEAFYLDALQYFAVSLPLFFLSGLIALSFNRLSSIRKEQARSAPGTVDTTRNWLITLTLLWGAIVGTAIVLETFTFQTIQALLLPLWIGLGLLVTFILEVVFYIVGFIAYLFAHLFGLQPFVPLAPVITRRQGPVHPNSQIAMYIPPIVFVVGRFVLLALILIGLVYLIRRIILRWRASHKVDEVEEVREGLPVRSILRARRVARQQHQAAEVMVELEALDPNSARAHYRALLQAMAERSASIERRPDETPEEYQERLLQNTRLTTAVERQHVPAAVILDRLTRAYVRERYGGRRNDEDEYTYLNRRVPYMIERLRELVRDWT